MRVGFRNVELILMMKKQKADILAFKRDENLIIPDKINYDGLSGLSNEVKAKFKEIKPKTEKEETDKKKLIK